MTFMPHEHAPETLESIEELREKHLSGFQIPVFYQNSIDYEGSGLWPIDIRLCGLYNSEEQFQPSLSYWFKVRGKLSEESALHRCALAYASDLFFGSVSLKPHLRKDMKILTLCLDHSYVANPLTFISSIICFHRPVKADDWFLFVMEAPSSCNGRGFSTGRMFNRKGELVMSLAQEALLREVRQRNQKPQAKL
ncbi:hypothetical protein J5N97_023057 [Dioscorea zingiberensis]|uniref:Acyl-CoA thioesterase-like C-terminal domain-containing protein n=1 Tax=Dioscorea zingiberensis TaxID=325984 RepID=A0A9D5CD70_9LILI|nr:hypothetical protein J5N97_023057 [Dioscorea zingiberensis]